MKEDIHEKCKNLSFETLCIHGHQEPEEPNYPVSYPIYQTVNFAFKDVKHAQKIMSEGSLFDHDKKGLYIYSRGANPTTRTLELLLADLENAEDGVAFSSGMAAITSTVLGFVEKGDSVYANDILYGETFEFFANFLPKYGVKVNFIDMNDLDLLENKLSNDDKAKLVFLETPANPTLKVYPLEEITRIAHSYGVKVVVDNTFATPYFQKPRKFGVDIVVHSATKYIGGHSDVLGGVVVGSFEDMAKVRQNLYTLGGALDPFAAWLLLRGLKTLHVRMKKHFENALAIAEWLEQNGLKVYYPFLKSSPYYDTAVKQMSGFSGIVSFDVGDYEKATKILENTKIFIRAVSLGGVESLINHPASTTHFHVPRDVRGDRGITDGLIRLSVGIENLDDLINDLRAAFEKAGLNLNPS